VAPVNDTSAATPLPVRLADGVAPVGAVYATATVAPGFPTAVGANRTLTVHEAPTANEVPQFGALPGKAPVVTRVNGEVAVVTPVMVTPARAELPVFATVKFCVALVVPTV
jgi:hypothetical protein